MCDVYTEDDRGRSRYRDVDPSCPPTADVARCDLLAQLGALLLADSSSSAPASRPPTAVTGPPPPRSTSTPGGMLRPDDSVPSVDTSPSSTVPNDESLISETVTSGIFLLHKTFIVIAICVYYISSTSSSLGYQDAPISVPFTSHSVCCIVLSI